MFFFLVGGKVLFVHSYIEFSSYIFAVKLELLVLREKTIVQASPSLR